MKQKREEKVEKEKKIVKKKVVKTEKKEEKKRKFSTGGFPLRTAMRARKNEEVGKKEGVT